MGPANVVFDRLHLLSWCIPKPWTNSLPLELMFVLLGLSLWDFKTFTHYLSRLNLVWMMRINRSHFLSASSIANTVVERCSRWGRTSACNAQPFPNQGPFIMWDLKTFIDHIVNYTTRHSRDSSLIPFSWASLRAFSWFIITTRHFTMNVYYREIAHWLACTVRDLHHYNKEGGGRARPWMPKGAKLAYLPMKRLRSTTTRIIINAKHFEEMNYHDRTELLNRYIPRHSQRVAWGSATRSSKGQTLPHENNKM